MLTFSSRFSPRFRSGTTFTVMMSVLCLRSSIGSPELPRSEYPATGEQGTGMLQDCKPLLLALLTSSSGTSYARACCRTAPIGAFLASAPRSEDLRFLDRSTQRLAGMLQIASLLLIRANQRDEWVQLSTLTPL